MHDVDRNRLSMNQSYSIKHKVSSHKMTLKPRADRRTTDSLRSERAIPRFSFLKGTLKFLQP